MPTYKIRGVDVDFPFNAYDCQLVYMEKVIQSLQSKCNALLESPTGTGKTLCLLCATLAWRKGMGSFSTGNRNESFGSSQSNLGSNLPTIIYASRTHSQLRQVIKELRRTNYRPKMMVLGSREQLCIHEDVKLLHGKAQNNACHYLCRRKGQRQCNHFTRVSDFMKNNPHLGDDPVDIEDLIDIGTRAGPCPYYISRELHKTVDILFAPYNYLIDRNFRKSLSINWESCVLIFDEAHNLENICADAASFDLSTGLLTACISEAKTCTDLSVSRREDSNDKSWNPDDFAILRALLLKLEKKIGELPIQSKELGLTKPGLFLYELFAELNITHDTVSKLIKIVEDAAILLEENKQNMATAGACRLESIGDILQIAFSDKSNDNAKFYRVHIREVDNKASDVLKGKASRTLSWWCFNPGITMRGFLALGVGSIILTSGTLSPLDSFAQELKLDFPIRLQNPHVISSSQIWAGVVSVGPSGRGLNSSYRNRDSLEYQQELGNAIVNFSRIVPDGLLVFFPSYYLLDQCVSCWKNASLKNSMTVWERICKHKKPVVEPRQSSLFPSAIEDFMNKLKDKSNSGAVFFAVCRGKVSEGLDFADRAGRAVVIVGMPFASKTEAKVRLKREFLDEQLLSPGDRDKVLSGEEWYTQQASRAVNQAVGRVIRHRHDYGAILFCDERFGQSCHMSRISVWIQPHINCYSSFGDVVYTLSRFFRDGGPRDSVKLSCAKIEDTEDGVSRAVLKCRDTLTVLVDKANDESVPLPSINKCAHSSLLKEVPPANRLHINYAKEARSMPVDLKNTLGQRKTLDPGLQTVHAHATVDREKLLVPCCIRNTKVLDAGIARKRIFNNSFIEDNAKLVEDAFAMRLAKEKNFITSSENGLVDASQEKPATKVSKRKVESTSLPSGYEESNGSMFLSEVKGKLSTEEYIEFIESMRALKFKTIKITDVFQSIARLFGEADKFPLLQRFKEFVPPKYHALYDQYLDKKKEVS